MLIHHTTNRLGSSSKPISVVPLLGMQAWDAPFLIRNLVLLGRRRHVRTSSNFLLHRKLLGLSSWKSPQHLPRTEQPFWRPSSSRRWHTWLGFRPRSPSCRAMRRHAKRGKMRISRISVVPSSSYRILFRVGNGRHVNLWFHAVHISARAMRGYIGRVRLLRDDILSSGKVSNEFAGKVEE